MSWVDRSSDLCIFSATQLNFWDFPTMKQCPWFQECSLTFYTIKGEETRKQACPIELPADDVDMMNYKDEVPKKEVQPNGKGK